MDRTAIIAGIVVPLASLAGAAAIILLPGSDLAVPAVLGVAAIGGVGTSVLLGHRPQAGASVEPTDGWSAFMREIERARRYERPMALLRIHSDPIDDHEDALVDRVRARTRQADTVWGEGDAVFVVLPESGRPAVSELLGRLMATTGLTGMDVRSAVFPDDSVTAGGLLALIHGDALDPVPLPLRAAREALAASTSETELARAAEDGRG